VVVNLRIVVAAGIAWATAAGAQGVDADAARNVAAGCASCHGIDGISVGGIPSLAGTARAELVARLREYKSGARNGTVMPQLAKGYTDAQLESAAAWFAAQRAQRP